MMKNPHSRLFFILFALLALLALLLAPWALPARAAPLPAKTLKPSLCGKLVFLTDFKTGLSYIGLIPCGGATPYIFERRPAQLYDYYRFADVVIETGPGIMTESYGRLTSYITKFKSYVPINNCAECSKAAGPTSTPESTQDALACSAWLIDQAAVAFPSLSASGQLQEIEDKTTFYTNGPVIRDTCGVNAVCMVQESARQMGLLLAPALRQESIAAAQVIAFLGQSFSAAPQSETCPQAAEATWYLAVGLNQQGYGVDIYGVRGPAALLLSDEQGRQTGAEPGQAAVQEIPASLVTVVMTTTYLLAPTSPGMNASLQGSGFGTLDLGALVNSANQVQITRYLGVLVTDSTTGEVTSASLMLDTHGSGSPQSRLPDESLVYPLLVARAGEPTPSPEATLSPTLTATVAVTPSAAISPATPSPAPPALTSTPLVAAPTATSAQGRTPLSYCPLSAGGMVVGLGIIGYAKKRRRTGDWKTPKDKDLPQ